MSMKYKSFLLLALLLATSAQADIFKCADPISGKVTYTNTKIGEKGCTLLTKDQSSAGAPARSNGANNNATPAQFPRVDSGTQRARDSDRRKILESERSAEEKLLVDAKKELADQEAVRTGDEKNYARVQERLKPFQDKVDLHERNIAAIDKELGNTR
jgi:septal ring factor EnvC (AmiA/AmiB activator)